jgi:phosphatidate cytidylyltransferase
MPEKVTRITIGSALIAALLAIVVGDDAIGFPLLGSLIVLAMTLMAETEFLRIVRGPGRPVLKPLLLVTTAIFAARAFWQRDPGAGEWPIFLLAVLCVPLMACFEVFRLQGGGEKELREHGLDLIAAAGALAYVALPLAVLQALALALPRGTGTAAAATYVLISKCGDIGGYLAGSTIGKRRVMPRVSPKKSWEGSIAGMLLTVAVAFAAWHFRPGFFPGLETVGIVIFSIVVNVATQMGDFAESMIKRAFGVKDSASLIPTFGGALDIVDSLVFAIPAAAFVLWCAA